MVDATVHGAGRVAADLVALGIGATARVHGVVVAYGGLLETAVKRHAAEPRTTPRPGPGGPRLLTGNYNRSIGRRITHTATDSVAEVGTNAPQGRRLEMGFVGADSLGRVYHAKSYPHFGPALDEIQPQFDEAIAAAVAIGV